MSDAFGQSACAPYFGCGAGRGADFSGSGAASEIAQNPFGHRDRGGEPAARFQLRGLWFRPPADSSRCGDDRRGHRPWRDPRRRPRRYERGAGRKSHGSGKRVTGREDLGGRQSIKKKTIVKSTKTWIKI